MKFRTILLGISGLLVAFAAAYFSVIGLSKLFAGASTPVLFMAGSLEFAKLIAASFLYNYWDTINKIVRTYLLIGVIVLITITSAGIYGYLTAAYQTTSEQLSIIDKQTEIIELKRGRFQDQLNNYIVEKSELNETITELSKGLSNNVIQYRDHESGQIITTTSTTTRKILTGQLNESKEQRGIVSDKIISFNDSITSLDLQVLDLKTSNTVAAELGPLKYLSEMTGKPMNKIVNWFALFIIFVFDPMAVSLIIAFNTAMQIDKKEKDLPKSEPSHDTEDISKYLESVVSEADNISSSSELNQSTEEHIHELESNKVKNTNWKNAYNGKPYFYRPNFDWSQHDRWIWDTDASKHWVTHAGGSRSALEKLRMKHPKNQ